MVDYIEKYKNILQKCANVFSELIQLYMPDRQATKDWADITISEATTQRNGLLERYANPKLTSAYTSTLVSSIGHFLDSHWADYIEFPTANPEKRSRVEYLHAELELLIKDVAPIHNAIR